MKGIVEIYSGDKLVYQDNNLVVDGAGQTIVDMLTTSPSLSGIPSASALLDTSNYTIQAISFGKAKKAFLYNAHAYDSSSELGINTKDLFLAVSGSTLLSTNKAVAVVVASSLTTSSYSPVPTLPAATTPMDTKLAEGAYLSGNSLINLDTTQNIDGQNMNIMPYINYELFPVGQEGYGSYWGCWPEGSSTGGSEFYIVSSTNVIESTLTTATIKSASAIVEGTYSGLFNDASSMESRGWVGQVYDSINEMVGKSYNPNRLRYTRDISQRSGFLNRANMTFTPSDIGTSCFEGEQALLVSAQAQAAAGYFYQPYVAGMGLYSSATVSIASVYVKQPPEDTAATGIAVNLYDGTAPAKSHIAYFKFDTYGGAPTLLGSTLLGATYGIDDVGCGWYRLQVRLEGLGTDTSQDDERAVIFYLGDNINPAAHAHKAMYFYGPQLEEHPLPPYERGNQFRRDSTPSATRYLEVKSGDVEPSEESGEGGLIVSSVADSSTTGEVIYEVTCGSGDLGTANLYGGIYQVGLHTIDVNNTTGNKPTGVAGVKQNYEAPFDFHPYNKPRREYRLFSKHSFTKNLCYIEDDGTAAGALNYQDLKIIWRIKFL